jgi:hypothetical protein
MKVTLAQEHIDHFNKTGAIEFDAVFTAEECAQLLAQSEKILMERTHLLEKKYLKFSSNENLFMNGKNLFRDGLETKKLCAKKQIDEIAFRLLRKKPLKIAFDQFIHLGLQQDCPFKEDATLQEISSIRPILGALIVLLSPESLSIEEPMLPKKTGNALFVSGNVPLPLKSLFTEGNASLLIIAFTAGNAMYCLEPRDPHTHAFKKEGLGFGDALGENLCPTIYHR